MPSCAGCCAQRPLLPLARRRGQCAYRARACGCPRLQPGQSDAGVRRSCTAAARRKRSDRRRSVDAEELQLLYEEAYLDDYTADDSVQQLTIAAPTTAPQQQQTSKQAEPSVGIPRVSVVDGATKRADVSGGSGSGSGGGSSAGKPGARRRRSVRNPHRARRQKDELMPILNVSSGRRGQGSRRRGTGRRSTTGSGGGRDRRSGGGRLQAKPSPSERDNAAGRKLAQRLRSPACLASQACVDEAVAAAAAAAAKESAPPRASATVLRLLTDTVDELKETRHWQQVVRVLAWYAAQPRAPPSLASQERRLWVRAMNTCARHGDARRAERLLQSMQECGLECDKLVNTAMMNAYGKAGEVEQAELMFRRMERYGSDPQRGVDVTAVGCLMHVYAQHKLFEPSMKLLAKARALGLRPNAKLCSSLVKVCGDTYRPQSAAAVVQWLRDEGGSPNEALYNAYIHALCKGGMYAEAEACLEDMKEDTAPSTRTFNSLYAGLNGSATMVARSKQLLEVLDAAGLMPTVVSYGIVLQACALTNDWEAAFLLKQRLDRTAFRQGPKIFGPLLALAGVDADAQRIEEVWSWVEQAGCQRTVELYGALLRSLGDGGHVEAAERTIVEMEQDYGQRGNKIIYTSLMRAYERRGDARGAQRVLQRMQDKGVVPDTICYNIALSACAKGADVSLGEAIMAEMSSPLSPVEADLVSYNCYMMAMANTGRWETVEQLLVELETKGMNADEFTYVALVRAYLNANMLENAVQVLERIRAQHSVREAGYVYDAVIAGLARSGQYERALRVFQSMRAGLVQPTAKTRDIIQDVTTEGQRSVESLRKDVLRASAVVGALMLLAIQAGLF